MAEDNTPRKPSQPDDAAKNVENAKIDATKLSKSVFFAGDRLMIDFFSFAAILGL